MTEQLTWRELAVGVGLIGIVAYFLWPNPVQAAVEKLAEGPTALQSVSSPDLPAYLTANRPGYAMQPDTASGLAAWPLRAGGLPMPDGLVLNPDGLSYRGGNWVGGNYVGANVSITNPGSYIRFGGPEGTPSGAAGAGGSGGDSGGCECC